MRIRPNDACLLIIDIQERLFPAISGHAEMAAHALWLQQVAQRIGIPVLLTEQYSKGLGPTIAALRENIPAAAIVEKLHFSAVSEGNLLKRPGGERAQFMSVAVKPMFAFCNPCSTCWISGGKCSSLPRQWAHATRRQTTGAATHAAGRCSYRLAGDGGLRMAGAGRQRPVPQHQPGIYPLTAPCDRAINGNTFAALIN